MTSPVPFGPTNFSNKTWANCMGIWMAKEMTKKMIVATTQTPQFFANVAQAFDKHSSKRMLPGFIRLGSRFRNFSSGSAGTAGAAPGGGRFSKEERGCQASMPSCQARSVGRRLPLAKALEASCSVNWPRLWRSRLTKIIPMVQRY